jgi:predicted aspartyl protease
MGKVIEKIRLTSLFEPARSIEVEAVIDTGATMLVLPQDIIVVDPSTRKVVPNPRSPEMPMVEIL